MKRILSVLIAISFALSGCTAEEEKMEFNGTEYHEPVSVPDFTLTDQEGNNVSLSDFKGKVVVVAFIFTSCPDVCPAIEHTLNFVDYKLPDHGIENDVEFIFQDEINLNNTTNSFLIGPLSRENVRKIDGSVSKNSALFLNEAESNLYISLGNKSQINVLNKYLDSKKISRIGIISDPQGDKNSEKKFKEFWLNGYRDAITIEADSNMNSENIIKNFLDVSESIERFEKINKASFSKLEFIPRTRDDINQIIIFPKSANRLYELASLIRFNYGLDYEIIALTSELAEKINQNEIELHGISLIDHTYENKFGYDLNKSRSFSLGYDSILIAYAVSNQIRGEVRGLLGTYIISEDFIEINSYIN